MAPLACFFSGNDGYPIPCDGADGADGPPTQEVDGVEVDDDRAESYAVHPEDTSTELANGHDIEGGDDSESDDSMVDEELGLQLLVRARRASDERRKRRDS
jgi:hypothetical protein